MQFVTSFFLPQNVNFEPPYSCQNNTNVPSECTKWQILPYLKNNSACPQSKILGCIDIFKGAGDGHPNCGSCEQGHRFALPHAMAIQDPGHVYIYIYIYIYIYL